MTSFTREVENWEFEIGRRAAVVAAVERFWPFGYLEPDEWKST